MSKWLKRIRTKTRDQALLATAITARGAGMKSVTQRLLTVSVQSVDLNNGKSMLTDGMVAFFADDLSIFKLPRTIMEDEPGQIINMGGGEIVKRFNVGGMDCPVSYGREPLKWTRRQKITSIVRRKFNIESSKGLCLKTKPMFVDKHRGDINIHLCGKDKGEEPWYREWTIRINDPRLRKPRMERSLDQLEALYGYPE